ncbi:Linear gramicidin dehydrogenase LgrE [Pseudoalteromonas holothuriae]|uniref:Linear gramicidin dehydrogenase LgrE n=1 Tax=Pseudoalteromonas holothuriae TaxID=2963714 RepID=A0A9W4QZA7_9GAMM|nr:MULTISPECIES: thioesterase domain-containing protein [unclassified Pseudoalteromonas]CAH9060153.1 Linear gramicidin dehydrogenase LgrE [Pseudoalteromonas sp. CIP111854]CAH9063343.1 Linear gramicidin dehydrogenase LgrE [Pseudoalteromonas sp. CIP111951]
MSEKWIVKPSGALNGKPKLLCFPYAGGGVSIFNGWAQSLSDVEVNIIQAPGRGSHFAAAPLANMEKLIDELFIHISTLLEGPYLIFGHSLGSRVGFEVARKAISLGLPAPIHFFASGSGGPDQGCFKKPIHALPQAEFFDEIKSMAGTPKQILENKELMIMLEPLLRADFKISEQYKYLGSEKIISPVSILYGMEDDIELDRVKSWARYFDSHELHAFEGGHFFIDTHQSQVLDIVRSAISRDSWLSSTCAKEINHWT